MTLFEQDFLMKQIQYLTQILQQIIFKKNQNQHQEAIKEIQDAFQRLTKDHPKQFHELNLDETLDIFMINGQFQSELAVAVADLLVEEAKIRREKSYSKSQKCQLQALLLYKKTLIDKSAAVPLNIREKIEELEISLSQLGQLDELNRILP
jgi:hypothetical protein